MVTVTADKNPEFETNPGKDTQDRVFLLSIPEANQYFASVAERQCKPTDYAKAQGCSVNSKYDWACLWWLRSPGDSSLDAASVNASGSVYNFGSSVVVFNIGVRPALWVDLRKIDFELDLATPGAVVTFGAYEQDNDVSNGKEPVEWIVLDVRDGRSLVLSKFALDCQKYNSGYTDITWETCSLRTWLNDTFLKDAFSTEEQVRIPTVTVTADKNPGCVTDPGKDTQDKVFLLSIPEVEKYFASDAKRQCKPTAYAIAQTCYVNSNGICWWWLRSPGYDSDYAAYVGYGDYGSLNHYGSSVDDDLGVRPALWVNLDS